jgi:dTDP-4-dehydrorhamnose reductase
MNVLVTGAAGQLGSAMIERLGGEHAVTAWARQDVDLTEHRSVRERVLRLAPDAIVNCASYNEVDRAQDEQAMALEVNALVVGTLARAAAALGATLVHYSTDFVFSGAGPSPYTEQDRPEPQSVYGQSKLMGEWLAADAPRHYVFRVESLFGGPRRRSSIDRIIEAVRSEKPARVFHDRIVSPSFVGDVTDAAAHVLRTQPAFGLYHCVNDGHATWLDVGREIVRRLGRAETLLQPVSVRDVPMRAARPQYAALSNAKLTRAGYAMPAWQDAIRRYLSAGDTP